MRQNAKKRTAETVRSTGEDAYFAASNSAKGFHSYYPLCFDSPRVGRLYAVKGGPGTGKSRFFRDVATEAEKAGWNVEYVYCSSDPDSLDGVILTREGKTGIALIDATAPHVYEPNRPGYREELVNLGAFWNGEVLREEGANIAVLNRRKQNAYRRAYRYLSGYGEMTATRDELVAPYLRIDAMRAYAERLTRDLPTGERFAPTPALIRSVGMRGVIALDTFFATVPTRYCVEDCRGSAAILMGMLYEAVAEKQLAVRVSRDPILPEKLDGLCIPGAGIAFAVGRSRDFTLPHKRICMRRFVDTGAMREGKEELNRTERMRRAMLEGAVEQLDRVRDAHFRVEEIYIRAMDFAAKEEFTRAFCSSLFR